MGLALVWLLSQLLLLLLEAGGAQELSCESAPPVANWSYTPDIECLNMSSQGLKVLQGEMQASGLKVLDLSGNNLRRLPGTFFAGLKNLRVLDTRGNPLAMVDEELGRWCWLELRSTCACALGPWHAARNNCSDAPQCHPEGSNHTQNLTLFLQAQCPQGLSAASIGGIVAGVCVVLALGVAPGIWWVWKMRGPWGAQGNPSQGQAKAWTVSDTSRPGSSRQPRYSSRARNPRPAPTAASPPSPPSPDYENMFHGEPVQPSWGNRHQSGPSEDSNFYLEYNGADTDAGPQAIYCNLPSQHHPCTPQEDDEDYVVPGH